MRFFDAAQWKTLIYITQGFQKDYSRNLKGENIAIEHNKKVTNTENLQGKKTYCQYNITALKLNHIVYRKRRRGAHRDKLILCHLKLRQYNKKLVVFNKKVIKRKKF